MRLAWSHSTTAQVFSFPGRGEGDPVPGCGHRGRVGGAPRPEVGVKGVAGVRRNRGRPMCRQECGPAALRWRRRGSKSGRFFQPLVFHEAYADGHAAELDVGVPECLDDLPEVRSIRSGRAVSVGVKTHYGRRPNAGFSWPTARSPKTSPSRRIRTVPDGLCGRPFLLRDEAT